MTEPATRPRRPGPTVRYRVDEWRAGAAPSRRDDRVIAEEPLEIRLEWPGVTVRRLMVTMRTPGADFDLAAGYLLGEGIARDAKHLRRIAYCTDEDLTPEQTYNTVTVTLAEPPHREPAARSTASTSACGVCGKDSLAAVVEFGGTTVTSDATVLASTVASLPDRLRERQRLFGRTGAVHAAGVFSLGGDPLWVREDVGRHNAVDKVVGAAALESGPGIAGRVLCTSARAGFEIVQKAVMAQVPVVAAVGAASSMAIECANDFGVTLIGFVRDERFVVYSHADRVDSSSP